MNGDVEEALSWQEQSHEEFRRLFGEESPRALAAAVRLMDLLALGGKSDRALTLARKIAHHVDAVAGDAAFGTAFRTAHAAALLDQKQYAAARSLLEEAAGVAEREDVDSWKAARVKCLLGRALWGMQEYTEAEALLLQAVESLRQEEDRLPVLYRRVAEQAAAALADLYETRSDPGDAARAAEYRKLAAESIDTPPE